MKVRRVGKFYFRLWGDGWKWISFEWGEFSVVVQWRKWGR